MGIEWQRGVIRRIIRLTPLVRQYWIELPETHRFDFAPGQFVTIDFPIHEKKNKRWRSYSIASVPDGSNTIELVISYFAGGLASEYIFNELREGSELTLKGPLGSFLLPHIADRDLLLICTGTGIVPFRSMLLELSRNPVPHQAIHLVYGCRSRENVIFADEMKSLETGIRHFLYHPVLSREQWEGASGYVHEIYESLCIPRQPAVFMLCGWHAMVDEARHRIAAMGYDKASVKLELYG